jgi:hypothetical protein
MSHTQPSRASRPRTLVPPQTAAHLTGASTAAIERAIVDGAIYTERIRNNLYVCLEDVTRLAERVAREVRQ